MKFNKNILVVFAEKIESTQPAYKYLAGIHKELLERGIFSTIAETIEDGLKLVKESPKYSLIALVWSNKVDLNDDWLAFIKKIRERNEKVPIFLFSEDNITEDVSLGVLKEIKEYVYLHSETPEFTANRLYSAVSQFEENLLPPYFKTLKNFTESGDYYWDCPGHMGGMAYLKHPVGIKFINFFGENMMRADIGVATAEMGDYLIHAGPSKKSEANAAKLFGADWTFYGVAGSSGSNRIVAQGAIGENELVLMDRNCHKSLNHGLTLSRGRPVYLTPTRNGLGLIGPIPVHRLKKAAIDQLIEASPLKDNAVDLNPTYAVITNCTYDGFCYNVKKVVEELKFSVPRIHFDEAWYAYAKFHPLYKGRFAMDVDDNTPDRPTLFAVHSTHKMLPALSMASMIHVKKSDRAPLDFDDFNDSFMMHGTTSPYYPIIASIDVAVSMMQGQSGESLVQESIEEAIAFRQALVSIKEKLSVAEGQSCWFFDVLQPKEVKDPSTGKKYSFTSAPIELLSSSPDVWTLKENDVWHGFENEDVANSDIMLDPVKVTITCPGLSVNGQYQDMGIPGYIITKFLDDRNTEIARTGDYTLLILFSVGTTKGKWGTLIESLLEFKNLYDTGAPAIDAIPSLKGLSPKYEEMTLKELCQDMHEMMHRLDLIQHISEAVHSTPEPVLSPAEAYQKVVRYKTEHIPLSEFSGRIAASMLVPYPPGIPVLMPGERLAQNDKGIIGYLQALETFDKEFPGFDHEIQGVNIDQNGNYWVRAIIEDEGLGKALPKHVRFNRKTSTSIKKGR